LRCTSGRCCRWVLGRKSVRRERGPALYWAERGIRRKRVLYLTERGASGEDVLTRKEGKEEGCTPHQKEEEGTVLYVQYSAGGPDFTVLDSAAGKESRKNVHTRKEGKEEEREERHRG